MKAQRIINGALIVGLVVSLIGGALTLSKLLDTARVNSELVCILGKAVSAPLKPRQGETRMEFHRRVKIARQFVRHLRDELEDCNAKQPPVVTVDPESKNPKKRSAKPDRSADSGTRGNRGTGGGGRSSGSPGSQPGPPSGGPPGGPSPPGNPRPGPPNPFPPSPNPGQNPNPLRPALDNLTDTAQGTVDSTCETVNGLGVPLC